MKNVKNNKQFRIDNFLNDLSKISFYYLQTNNMDA